MTTSFAGSRPAAAFRVAALGARPVRSGLAYGVVVYAGMQLLLAVVGAFHAPTPSTLALALVDHTVFFGLPVALVVARLSLAKDGR